MFLEKSLGYTICTIARKIHQNLTHKFSPYNITPEQWVVFNPNDKRAFFLSTTNKGIEFIDTLNEVDISVISDVEKSLTKEENILLLELLSKIEKNFSSSSK